MPVIEIDKLSKFYRRTPGVVELDLSVREGEIFGFVGPNGAGKSTAIRIMMGYLRPSSGSAKIFGMDAFMDAALIKRDVGYVPGIVNYYHNLKAMEILEIASSFRRKVSRKYVHELCELFEVDLRKPFGKMSVGNRKKIAIVQALMHRPRLLIMDEATSGLDVLMRKRLLQLLREANMEGATVFFCGNNLSEVQEICGRTAIIRGGSIIETQETADFTGDLARKISVRTGDDISSALEVLKIKDVKRMDDYLVFLYDGGMDTLIKALANFRLDDLQISLPSLEDAIFRYYEKKMEREEELFQ